MQGCCSFPEPQPSQCGTAHGMGRSSSVGARPPGGEMGCLLHSSQIISLSLKILIQPLYDRPSLITSVIDALNFEERPARSSSLKIVR